MYCENDTLERRVSSMMISQLSVSSTMISQLSIYPTLVIHFVFACGFPIFAIFTKDFSLPFYCEQVCPTLVKNLFCPNGESYTSENDGKLVLSFNRKTIVYLL